ncbi:unnamed protein product [Microthlaspi erraticum]|uniref:RING-type E3 ubiquitin transferase n=1 Tax=Microthlaspi erraticum TaxID=1685480 RepID=A0A6D2I536_9BRAS|nr:unnamed protein product [Microthlaspi erraticum]
MDLSELEENLFAASDAKLHRDMCKELSAVYCKVLSIFPSLEEARPRSKSGIQALCSLHIALEKAKNILQHCSECSKLYLAITGDAVLLKFEKAKSALIDSLKRVEDIVPSSIGSQILDIVGELEHTKFLLDPSEKEVGDRIIALLQQGKKFDNCSDNAELEIFHQAATRLSITSSRSALAERRALKKLIDRARVEEDKRKESIVAYLLHLMRKYSKLFRSEIMDENDSQGSPPCSPTGNEDRTQAFGRQLSKFGSINFKPVNSRRSGGQTPTPPEELRCPISLQLMCDPVIIASGQTYERVCIEKWFGDGHNSCPKTQQQLPHLSLTPNYCVKGLVASWCEQNGITVPTGPPESLDLNYWRLALSDSESNNSKSVKIVPLEESSSIVSEGQDKEENNAPDSDINVLERYQDILAILDKEEDLAKKCKVMENVRLLLKDDEEARILMGANGFVEAFLRFLESAVHQNNAAAQETAAMALFNLAVNNNRNKELMLTSGVIPLLEKMISCSHSQGPATALYLNLSCLEKAKPVIGSSQAVPIFVNLLLQGEKTETQCKLDALHALYNLSTHSPNVPTLLSSNIIKSLQVLASTGDHLWIEKSLAVLLNLATSKEGKEEMISSQGMITTLATVLDIGDTVEQEQAVSCLVILCSGSESCIQMVLQEGVIPSLVSISVNGSPRGRDKSQKLLMMFREQRQREQASPNRDDAPRKSVSAPLPMSVPGAASVKSGPHQHLCHRRLCAASPSSLSSNRFLKPNQKGLKPGFSAMAFLGLIKRVTRTSRHNWRVREYPFQRRELSNASSFHGEDAKLPVLIVGAGPVGLVLSILLTKLGVKCAVVDKSTSFSKHPQAHFINNRSMEIFRNLNGLAEEIERSQPPLDLWRKFIYCTSLSGSTLGTVDHMQPQDFEKLVSPASVAHFSQYKLTSLLLKRLIDLGFHVPSYKESDGLELDSAVARQILMGHECVAINANNKESVTATVSFLKGGKCMKRDIQCGILVGADGAGSSVRRLTEIEMRGERDLQKLISVHFMSRELGEYLIKSRPGMLFFIFNTGGIGVLVAHDLQQGEFVLQIPYYPPQQSLSDFSPEMCKMLISNLVGHELSDLDVADIKPWIMHAEVAEKFMCCENRVILAGDAAHRFPPAGGFGMNTGIQDAHNLAWKIAALVQGSAKSSILNTYETERRPIALFNTSLSIQNFRAAMSVPSALGLDPTVSNSVHRFINNTVGSILPTGLQKAILDNVFALGRAQLSESLLNENNPLGSQRLSRLKNIFEGGKSLQLQFPAEDLGFRYLEGAIVPDNESEAGDPKVPSGRRRDYVPSSEPGSRLPHMYVRILSDSTREAVVSTLDLVSTEKVEFLLIISPLQESYELAHATFKMAKELMANVKVCVVWPSSSDDAVERESKSALAPWDNYVDVMEVGKQNGEDASWWNICKMSERGCILVRPDQHIGWRAKSGVTSDPTLHMRNVFSIILGKQ